MKIKIFNQLTDNVFTNVYAEITKPIVALGEIIKTQFNSPEFAVCVQQIDIRHVISELGRKSLNDVIKGVINVDSKKNPDISLVVCIGYNWQNANKQSQHIEINLHDCVNHVITPKLYIKTNDLDNQQLFETLKEFLRGNIVVTEDKTPFSKWHDKDYQPAYH